jgi:hypothetical protein
VNQALPALRRPGRRPSALCAFALLLALAPRGAAALPRLLEGELRSPFADLAAAAPRQEMPTATPSAGAATPPAPAADASAAQTPAVDAPANPAPPADAAAESAEPPPPAPPGDAAAEAPKKPDLSPAPHSPAAGSLDFDLLGDAPAPPPAADGGQLRLRRTMLTVHQSLGFGLVALQLGTTVLGQLNYSDKFAGSNTGKYETAHALTAYSTLGLFAATGLLALLAPKPIHRDGGFDRVTLHKIAMLTAAAGMVAQGVLGIATREREGFRDQQSAATAHLVIGYVTLGAVLTGVSALVF